LNVVSNSLVHIFYLLVDLPRLQLTEEKPSISFGSKRKFLPLSPVKKCLPLCAQFLGTGLTVVNLAHTRVIGLASPSAYCFQ